MTVVARCQEVFEPAILAGWGGGGGGGHFPNSPEEKEASHDSAQSRLGESLNMPF